nr:pupal cuticle protein 27-like [Penaeus vannamei]
MDTFIVLCMAAAASAVPQYNYQGQDGGAVTQLKDDGAQAPPVEILKDEREGPDASGAYSFSFETATRHGTSRRRGQPSGAAGAVASQGGWTFTFPDGSSASFSFEADEGGYRVESDLLPTPPPLPAHAIAQVEKAKQEDAAAATASPPAIGVAPADSSGPLYAASVLARSCLRPAPAPVHTPATVPGSVPAFARHCPCPHAATVPASSLRPKLYIMLQGSRSQVWDYSLSLLRSFLNHE